MKLMSDDEIKIVKYIYPAVLCIYTNGILFKDIEINTTFAKIFFGVSLLIADLVMIYLLSKPCELLLKFIRTKAETNKFFKFLSNIVYILSFILCFCLAQTPYNY